MAARRLDRAIYSFCLFALAANLCGTLTAFLKVTRYSSQQSLHPSRTRQGAVAVKDEPESDASAQKDKSQDGTVSANSNQAFRVSKHQTIMEFIPSRHFGGSLVYFSATWIQPIETFLKLNTGAMKSVECGVF